MSESETVYLAAAEAGEYSDHRTMILGVYADRAMAQKACVAFIADCEAAREAMFEGEYETENAYENKWGDEYGVLTRYSAKAYVVETTIARVFTPGFVLTT